MLTMSGARRDFAQVLNRVAHGKERVAIGRRGRPVAVLVPIEDFEDFERMEAEADLRAYIEAKAADQEKVPLEEAEAWLDEREEQRRARSSKRQ